MDTSTNIINWKDLHFPVFSLGISNPIVTDGVIFYVYYKRIDDGTEVEVVSVVDDKNIEEPTLSRRRLRLLASGVRLRSLKTAIFSISDLIKVSKAKTWFIDSAGILFNYKKQNNYKMVSKKITKVIPIPTGGSIIEVAGLPSRFKLMYNLPESHDIAILLTNKNKLEYVIYGTESSDKNTKLTRRKI